ncbi:MAG TPA: uroporphyrinogen-III synthase [Bryobacteraceae bacterium]|nr:uroporphyrinogen-III synthase [Bryobacteraceae bacterium]
MAFDGLRVLSLESRRSAEIERLIRSRGGEPTVAPSMREVPLEENAKAFEFASRLFAGEFEMMILLTGVGTRLLAQVIETRWPAGAFAGALKRLVVVARGPKPIAVLREWGVPVTIAVPEPNTWREILAALDGRPEKRIAVQEYGRPSVELLEGLRARGAEVTEVPVYQWDLPEDREPLSDAVRRLARSQFDVVMFTTSIQVNHLFRVAEELQIADAVRGALLRMVIASVGPTTSETLAEFGLRADLQPSHPKMGFLVNETAAAAAEILRRKQ